VPRPPDDDPRPAESVGRPTDAATTYISDRSGGHTMSRHTTPYVFGDERGDGGLEAEPESEHGTETVIVDGDAMSYRSYKAHEGAETE
jgi:hypothetical protein